MKCADCAYSFRPPAPAPVVLAGQPAALKCRKFPPTVTALVVPAQGGLQIVEHTSYPQVMSDWLCGGWTSKASDA